jgi:hypothetical protein
LQFPITLQLHSLVEKAQALRQLAQLIEASKLKAAASGNAGKEQLSAVVMPGLIPEHDLYDLFNCKINSRQQRRGMVDFPEGIARPQYRKWSALWKMIQRAGQFHRIGQPKPMR